VLVGALALVALSAPWLTAYDPDAIVVATYRGPLGPGGARIYRVRVRRKPKPIYIELREDQLVLIPAEA
jgi:hypothetical protein